jgi:transpeptidase family protein/penicillin-binding protein/MecA-like transpeptidase family protein
MHNVPVARSGRRWGRWFAAGAVVAALGAGAVATGAVLETSGTSEAKSGPDPRSAVRVYVEAWQAGDYTTMYSLLTRRSRRALSASEFQRAFTKAAKTATLLDLRQVGPVRVGVHRAAFEMQVHTQLFGTLRLPVALHLVPGPRSYGIVWDQSLAFPGLEPGQHLLRKSHAPATRGRIMSRDGLPLAEGSPSARVYPQGSAFAVVTGYLAKPTKAQNAARMRYGWPSGRQFGQGGLEAALDRVLAGAPRINLVGVGAHGGQHRLARRPGRAPHDVTTTLVPAMQTAATAALGARYGGIVVLNAHSGAVEADAGIGMDALQPPGSSFKTVTVSAALKAGVATPTTSYAYARYVELNGWRLHNFHHESCGGSLVLAFAVSCNSVFAPLADSVGATRLVDVATKFGFNRRPTIAYPAPTSVTPAAKAMTSDLLVGVAGIGQGGVEATPLQMASVAQTIGALGLQRPPFIVYAPTRLSDSLPPRRVIPAGVAANVRTMMEAVVSEGTGTAAALPGVTVAGKTGTAEVGERPTDAWFIAFAPAEAPQVAVAVLIPNGGVGGEVAAPIARSVLAAALGVG